MILSFCHSVDHPPVVVILVLVMLMHWVDSNHYIDTRELYVVVQGVVSVLCYHKLQHPAIKDHYQNCD